MMFQRFAAASALTIAVGGVLIGAAPAMAATAHAHPVSGDHNSVKNHKKSDNDKFSNSSKEYCVTIFAPVIIQSDLEDTHTHINNSCSQRPYQENEGDENEIGHG